MSADHPLGYRKYYLLRIFGYAVRLHIWPPNAQISDKPHDHRWSFLSVPLWGRFVDTRYVETAAGSAGGVLQTTPDRGGGRSYVEVLEFGARGGTRFVSRTIRYPLLPYRCRIGEIHSYVPAGSGWHASLVLLGRERRQSSRVWS